MSEKRFTVEENDDGDVFFVWDNEAHSEPTNCRFGVFRKAQAKADRLNDRAFKDKRRSTRSQRAEWMEDSE